MLVYIFLGFFAIIVVCQIVPTVILVSSILRGFFSKELISDK